MALSDPLTEQLYRLIVTGQLSPGERVDQRLISELLGVSRTPLREALRALSTEGMLRHSPNQGYTVAKLSASELLQLYDLLAFLEDELLRSLIWPSARELAVLRDLKQQSLAAARAGDVGRLSTLTQQFHIQMFSWSPRTVMFQEATRLWRLTMPYRAFALTMPEQSARVDPAQRAMIAAIRATDRDGLVACVDQLRSATRALFAGLLSREQPMTAIPA